jgi:Protein of unknown function (DUF4239)
MNLTFLPRKAAGFFGGVLILLIVYVLLRWLGLDRWTAREAEGITVLVQLIGDIYAVLLAFMIFVIWTQFTEVENCVIREADSLGELLRYSAFLNDDARSTIRRAIANYVRQVLGPEWGELGEGRRERQGEQAFARLVAAVVDVTSKDTTEQFLRENLFETLRTVSRNRDGRLAKSLTRMPPTLSGLVKMIAGVLLLLIFLYPFHHTAAGAAFIAIAALVLFLANFVMTDTDNPLKGVWNVRPDAFSELSR